MGEGDMTRRTWTGTAALVAVTLGVVTSCALRLISEYDDTTDREVTQLQRSVDGFLLGLARNPKVPECTYQKRAGFYDTAAVALSSLTMRNRARARNALTVQQIELLDSSVATLGRLHRLKGDAACLRPEEIEPLRANFNTSFAAILRLELAKKRG